jgi:hypothetical protein
MKNKKKLLKSPKDLERIRGVVKIKLENKVITKKDKQNQIRAEYRIKT